MELLPRSEWNNREKELIGVKEDDCPFCDIENEEFKKYIIFKGEHFHVAHNKYPVLGMKEHLMAIPIVHTVNTRDLTKEQFAGLKEVEEFMNNFYGKGEYFTLIRQSLKSKSIGHLHYHYLPGNIIYDDLEEALSKKGYPKKES